MRASLLLTALAATFVAASSVPEGIAPDASPPDGCEETVDGNFTIGIAVLSSKHRRESGEEAAGTSVGCTLKDGILKDPYGRVGSIVANYQFQFDGPPQAGAIYTGGFSVCKNTSLALGGSTVWWRCMSGGFGNLYDRSIGDQCSDVRIIASMIGQSSSSSSATPSSTPASSSKTASGSVSASATPTPTIVSIISISLNSTITTGSPSTSGSGSASATGSQSGTATGSAASSGSTGGAVPTRLPKRETFGAVVGILGAALMF